MRRGLPVLGIVTGLLFSLVTLVMPQAAQADAAGRGGDYVPLANPHRVADTRNGTGGATGVRGPGSTTVYSVVNQGGIPATGVSAVLVDVALISTTAYTALVLWEDGTPRPVGPTIVAHSNTQTLSNSAIVPVSALGKIAAFNVGGNVHLSIDVQGYFTTSTGVAGRGGFVPTPHTWAAHTLAGIGAPKATVPANGNLTVTMPADVPASATSVFLDITAYGQTKPGWLAAYPAGGPAGGSVLDYTASMTSTGASVKLGTDRKIVISNRGTTPVHLFVSVEGYFTADPATGAGLRKAVGRLVGSQVLAANAAIDVPVGGRFGLPTRGIAGAAINFTVYSQAQPGHLRAWPAGTAEPAPTLNYIPANSQRSDQAIVKVGTDGVIRVRNVSNGPITLFADLQGWFADPLPQLPIERFARPTALQAPPATPGSVGTLEYSYVDNIGTLWHGHQPSLDNFGNVQWTAVPSDDAFTGRPALYATADNKLQVAAQSRDGNVWGISRQSAAPPAWGPWAGQGGSMASAPAVGKLADGSAVLFSVDADGKLWHYTASSWRSLGAANLVGTPTVEVIRDGLQLFGVTTAGEVVTASYRAGALSGWTNLGGTGMNGTPAVVRYPGFLLRVFVRSADGTIVTKRQDNESGPYSATWEPVGTQAAAGSPAAVLSPATGTTEVVIRGTDSRLYSTGELAQGSGTWRNWQDVTITPDDLPATDPSIVTYTNTGGANWGVVFRTINNRTYVYEYSANATMTARALPTPN